MAGEDLRLRVAFHDNGFVAWAQRNPERAQKVLPRFLHRAGQIAVKEMRSVTRERFGKIGVRHPGLGPPTGALGGSVKATLVGQHVDVGPHVPYAAFVNWPTAPHVIRAKRARFLHWTSRIVFGGKKSRKNHHFAKEVVHPGFQGHHFLERTIVRIRPKLMQEGRRLIEREVLDR